jgi:hypothetical protein
VTSDGRLREHLESVPENHWLNLFNARYLITDKVGDAWIDGVYYDQQHPLALAQGQPGRAGHLPQFEATGLRLIASGRPAVVEVETAAGERWTIEPQPVDQDLYEVTFPAPATAVDLRVLPCAGGELPCRLVAMTLVDDRDGTFQPLTPGDYRLIYSGDVKIYENLAVLPRAFVVADWEWVADAAAAVARLADPGFDAGRRAVLIGPEDAGLLPPRRPAPGTATITAYSPEEVRLRVQGEGPGLVVLTDSHYPGWQATVDGRPAEIFQADGLFRAVLAPAGESEVIFKYVPRQLYWGAGVALLGVVLLVALSVMVARMSGKAD